MPSVFSPQLGRVATVTAFVVLAAHGFILVDALVSYHNRGDDRSVPLRVSAELGVVSFGHWAWLTVPWILQAALCALNLWFARSTTDTGRAATFRVANALVGLLVLLGALSTMAAGRTDLAL